VPPIQWLRRINHSSSLAADDLTSISLPPLWPVLCTQLVVQAEAAAHAAAPVSSSLGVASRQNA